MSLLALLPQVVTIRHYNDGAVDADRNYVRTPAASTTTRARISATEITEPGGSVVERWLAVLPADAGVTASDELVDDNGRRFQVVGTPEPVYGATAVHHLECRLLYVGQVEDPA